jgi:arylsulfatase A-like enzyme
MPAAKQGLQDSDPTIAELLKPHGYATGQIGKNHLGDRNDNSGTPLPFMMNSPHRVAASATATDRSFRARWSSRGLCEWPP